MAVVSYMILEGTGKVYLVDKMKGKYAKGRDLGMPQFGGQQMAGDGHGSGGRVELPALPERLNPMELGDWLCLSPHHEGYQCQ